MEISKKRVLTDYVRKCIENGRQIRTAGNGAGGKYGFIPHEGEDKLFEQCYKEGDPIREQFPENYYLSEKYCHLVKVCKNKKVYFIKPDEYQKPANRKNWERRWRYFRKKDICPSGIPTYGVYGLVFGCKIFSDYERSLLEKNIYTAFGTEHGELITHHAKGYKAPELDEQGIPIFDEDARNLIIYNVDLHDTLFSSIPDIDTPEDKEKKYDEKLESLISEGDKEKKTRITSTGASAGERTKQTGSIILTDSVPESMEKFMETAGPEYPRCIITYKGPEKNHELYNQHIKDHLTDIVNDLNKADMGAGHYQFNDFDIYNGNKLDITVYKNVSRKITVEETIIAQPIKIQ